MLGFGTKKPLQLERFPLEQWVVAKCEFDGAPAVLRVNSGAKKYVAHPALPFRLGVTVQFREPNEHGFCTADEGKELSDIEDRLVQSLTPNQTGFPVLVITFGGRREFIFHVTNEAQATKAVEAVRPEITSHTLVYGLEHDPDWAYYSQFG